MLVYSVYVWNASQLTKGRHAVVQCLDYGGPPAGAFPEAGACMGAGADLCADQLALQLGLSRTQLGVNMPAMAIPLDRTVSDHTVAF